jgi:3-methyladenine DNA glycosylase AlkD
MLRAMVIAYAKMDTDERLDEYRRFIPLIDNWSVCDSFCNTWKPRKDEKNAVWDFILPYLRSGKEFEMRFSAVMMLCHFIDDDHIDKVIRELDSADNDGYYFKMAKAWTLSVCFVRYPELTYSYLERHTLDDETLRMTVRKIRESYRVSDEMKAKVRGLV